MRTANDVDKLVADQIAAGINKDIIAWEAAKACLGWAYVFGAAGEFCDIDNRRAYYARKGQDHPTIKTACQIMMGKSSGCSGCKYYPGGRTRFFDCRGFTRWVLKKVYGWVLQGGGCTQQWNTASNWKSKGKIADGFPKDTLVCLFYSKEGKERTWEHTGFGYNNETVECSNGVQYSATRNKKWTHWAVPQCVEGDVPVPTPPEPSERPTLRRGNSGPYVTLMQTELVRRGYNIGSSGIDGKFGKQTETALKEFQKDAGLVADGICGPLTWAALDDAPMDLYTVTIPHLTLSQADILVNQYAGAYKTAEEGR